MGVFISPFFISNNQLPELCPPITEVIDTNTSVSEGFVNIVNCTSDECRTEVVNGKVFGNVWGRIINDNTLSATYVSTAIAILLFIYFFQYHLCEYCFVHKEVHIWPYGLNLCNLPSSPFRKGGFRGIFIYDCR